MPAIVITLMQGLLLLLLYLFIARAVRAVLRDVTTTAPAAPDPARARRRNGEPRPSRPPDQRVAPRQLVVHRPDSRPQVITLNNATVLFGRSPAATVQLPDPYTSDRHAEVRREGGDWLVADLQSTNGTFVNQVKISRPTPLAAGDQLGIGRTVVEVRK